MKKLLLATAALIALPVMAHAQPQPTPGFYIGGEGGVNWMFNTTANVPGFVGPRIEAEGIFRSNQATLQAAPVGFQGLTAGAVQEQIAIMGNVLYDFRF